MADGAQTHNTILIEAAKLFASQGYSAVSMRDVANKVGVTPANLYYHFTDKDTLVRETLVHVLSERAEALNTIFSEARQPAERIRTFVTWLTHLLFEDKVFARLVFRELLDGDEGRIAYLATTIFEQPFLQLIDATAGERRLDARLTAASIVALILGHVQIAVALPYLQGSEPDQVDPGTVGRHIVSLIERVLQPPA
jgi:AcrR family transcriptional regulator